MLLSYGADPNIRVSSGDDDDTGTVLRPALAELIASNDATTMEELKLLLKYGARVSMRTQYRDPDGLLNCLSKTPYYTKVFDELLDAAENFDIAMIKRNIHLSDGQRKKLLLKAKQPLSLKCLVRCHFRRLYGRALPENVPCLFIPQTLRSYLLYEVNWFGIVFWEKFLFIFLFSFYF